MTEGYSSDEEGTSALADEAFIANGRRGIRVFRDVRTTNEISSSVYKQRTLHVNFRNEAIQVYGGSTSRNYYCRDLINVRRAAKDAIYFETKSSRMLNPKVFRFKSETEMNKFVAYVKSIRDYGQVIWKSFDELDFTKSGQITAIDLKEAYKMHDVPVDDEAIRKIMALSISSTGRFGFNEFIDALINSSILNLRDCLLELLLRKNLSDTQPAVLAPTPTEAADGGHSNVIAFAEESDMLDLRISDISQNIPSVSLLPGEVLFINITSARWVLCGNEASSTLSGLGHLSITNYRIILTPTHRGLTGHRGSRHYRPSFFNQFSFPLHSILRLALPSRPQTILQNAELLIHTKDCRTLKFTSLKTSHDTYPALMELYTALRKRVMIDKITKLFCFQYGATFSLDGWLYSDVTLDYGRMNLLDDSDWRLLDNTDGKICESYPSYICVPAAMATEQLFDCAAHRAQRRIPALSYRHGSTQTVIVRSSQPRTGLGDTVCSNDVTLLDVYRRSGMFNSAR